MLLVGFKLTISAGEQPKTYALDPAATGTGIYIYIYIYIYIHTHTHTHIHIYIYIYRVSREECARLRENVP